MRNEKAMAACHACHVTCQEVLTQHSNGYTLPLTYGHIKQLMAAAELCQVTANLLFLHAPLIDQLCELTARACEEYVSSMGSMDDQPISRSISACRQCAQALYEVSKNKEAA